MGRARPFVRSVGDLFLFAPLAHLMSLAGLVVEEGVELRINPAGWGTLQRGAGQGHEGVGVEHRPHVRQVFHQAYAGGYIVGGFSRQAKDHVDDGRQACGGDDFGGAMHVGDGVAAMQCAEQPVRTGLSAEQ
ncbi:MAG: hypothetical protein PVJ23_04080 [Anaerolineae bacterium]